MSRLLTLILSVCALVGVPAAASAGNPTPPNIVVFYMDDVSPHDGRLWSNPSRTPTLHNLFVEHGVEFTNAIGETPFCCPGRADVLTGLHTHNNTVVTNDGRFFRPGMHIGKALKDAGYASMYIGKYLNQNNKFSAQQWSQHMAGWTHMDAIRGANGDFYNYTVKTKNGPISYGHVHSTQMVADRAVAHINNTPANTPVFALLSVYNLHGPNTPMPQFANDPRCDSIQPWNSGSYNEANMSDKHPVIATLPKQPYPDGWPMVKYCREMLGVDWLVKKVTDKLAAENRLNNTLLVLTADNGIGWGIHRIGQSKVLPYTTPVPLFMSWPARWGSNHRQISEAVSNIDLAPTFCALAGSGCDLGPFPTGQQHADGLSLLPVLDDQSGGTRLGRNAVLESGWNLPEPSGPYAGLPWWQGLRTAPWHPLGHWHYIEWEDGFRELYNLETDPSELVSVASSPSRATLVATLSARLDELFHEGRTPMSMNWPDAQIAVEPDGAFKGLNKYTRTPNNSQTQRVSAAPSSTREFVVRVSNHHDEPATFRVRGSSRGTSTMTVQYLRNGGDVTSSVVNGNLLLQNVAAEGAVELVIRVTVNAAPDNATKTVDLTAMLAADPIQLDAVRAVVTSTGP